MSTHRLSNSRRVVVTGLGLITSIGNNREQVLRSLRDGRTGIEYYAPLERTGVPVRLAGTVKGTMGRRKLAVYPVELRDGEIWLSE